MAPDYFSKDAVPSDTFDSEVRTILPHLRSFCTNISPVGETKILWHFNLAWTPWNWSNSWYTRQSYRRTKGSRCHKVCSNGLLLWRYVCVCSTSSGKLCVTLVSAKGDTFSTSHSTILLLYLLQTIHRCWSPWKTWRYSSIFLHHKTTILPPSNTLEILLNLPCAATSQHLYCRSTVPWNSSISGWRHFWWREV